MGSSVSKVASVEEAAGFLRSRAALAVSLGSGQSAAFLHALGERQSLEHLTVFGSLLIDSFPLLPAPVCGS